ncbi:MULTISPECIES: MFS transporter [Niallia]|uniref:MFS transporter n=1 Tax=Niallia alba TaxID=2729105 RepID=A0A7Y0KBI7_9BACI|nr:MULTISPECIES: MFS transporter [Niallia]NMO79407.1 MFS transporter [Niallia alba]UTI42710.1 MFS transporter [Niallia sp. RD1]
MKNKILISKVSSLFGTSVFNTIVNLWILDIFNSSHTLGVILSISGISALLFSLLGGYLADSNYLKKILLWADLSSAIFCIISVFLISSFSKDIIYLVVFLLNINIALTAPLIKSLVSNVVQKELIISFNSILAMYSEILKIALPLISTFLYQFDILTLNGALIINAISFFISFLFVKGIQLNELNSKSKLIGYWDTLKYLLNRKVLSMLILTGGISNFFLAGFNLLLPVFALDKVGNSFYYGVFLSLESIGALCGALSTKYIIVDKMIIKERIGIFFSGILLSSLILFNSKFLLIFICFILNFFYVRYNVALQSFLQTDVNKEYIGKVFSVSYILSNVLLPLGSLFFGYLLEDFYKLSIGVIAGGLIFINLLWVVCYKKIVIS